MPSACGLALVNLTVQRASRSFCRKFCGLVFPGCWNLAGLDVVLFFFSVSLLRRGNEAGIDDLPRHGDVAGIAQHGVEAFEQRLDRFGLRQPLSEQADRARAGNTVRKPKAQEAHERQPVVYEELGTFVRQVVGGRDPPAP